MFTGDENNRKELKNQQFPLFPSSQNKLNGISQNDEITDSYHEIIRRPAFHYSRVQSCFRCTYLLLMILVVVYCIIMGMEWFMQDKENSLVQETKWLLEDSNLSMSSWSQTLNHYCKLSQLGNQVVPVILKMFKFTKMMENKEEWNSSFFFDFHGHGGHKTYLRVYAAGHGDGEGSHVSVYLYSVKGPYDDKLYQLFVDNGPQKGKFTIELLNQQDDINHYIQHVCVKTALSNDYDDDAEVCNHMVWGAPQFIPHDALISDRSNGYLKNDSIYFRINYEYERYSYFSHLMDHLLWTLPFHACVLAMFTLSLTINYRGNDGCGAVLSCYVTLYAMFAVGSGLGGILWMILTQLMTFFIQLLFEFLVVRIVFSDHTSVTFLSWYGLLISIIVGSFLARIILIDVFHMPWGVLWVFI